MQPCRFARFAPSWGRQSATASHPARNFLTRRLSCSHKRFALKPTHPPTTTPPQCLDLHSRLSQKQRDNATAAFAQGSGVLLFASDVIARGMDFPDVTLVVQVRHGWMMNTPTCACVHGRVRMSE